jgi:hypothetical protein
LLRAAVDSVSDRLDEPGQSVPVSVDERVVGVSTSLFARS